MSSKFNLLLLHLICGQLPSMFLVRSFWHCHSFSARSKRLSDFSQFFFVYVFQLHVWFFHLIRCSHIFELKKTVIINTIYSFKTAKTFSTVFDRKLIRFFWCLIIMHDSLSVFSFKLSHSSVQFVFYIDPMICRCIHVYMNNAMLRFSTLDTRFFTRILSEICCWHFV